MVAGIAALGQGFDFFNGRFGVVLSWLVLVAAFSSLSTSILGFKKRWLPLAILLFSFGGLAVGFLLTPDAPLLCAWVLAMHETWHALNGRRTRWLTAGVAVGLGLLSKYTMVLFAPIALWGVVKYRPSDLRSPQFWGGIFIATIVFLPNVIWNGGNEWTTVKFQLRHGFSMSQSQETERSLPRAEEALVNERAMVKIFYGITSDEELASLQKPSKSETKLERSFRWIGDFWGGVFGLWGGGALLLIATATRFRRLKFHGPRHFLYAAAFAPILFFAPLSPFTKIEANWPALAMPGCALLMAVYVVQFRSYKYVWFHIGLNLVALASVALAFKFGSLKQNRLVQESTGYAELSRWLASQNLAQVAVSSYQLTGMVKWNAPRLEVFQWPGVTRDSEFTRESNLSKIEGWQNGFTLVTSEEMPSHIPGFMMQTLSKAVACRGQAFQVVGVSNARSCLDPAKEWWISSYVPIASESGN
jgi:4-amino-4-deoxy-L-arabinose transferase-like glycosyltransferase